VPVYSVRSLDVLGNPVDGYEVNDSRALREVYIPPSSADAAPWERVIVAALVEARVLSTLAPAALERGELTITHDDLTIEEQETAWVGLYEGEGGDVRFLEMQSGRPGPRERASVSRMLEENETLGEVLGSRPIYSLEQQLLEGDFDEDGIFREEVLHFGPRFVGDSNTAKVANAFSRILRERLAPEELRQVVERNRAETNPDVCHSQDFCDANMAMNDAFEEAMDRGFDYGGDEADEEIWEAAWELAKTYDFTVPYRLHIEVSLQDEKSSIVIKVSVDDGDTSDTFWWPLADWQRNPSLGYNPTTGKKLKKPSERQLAEILVALDQALERL